MFYALCSWLIHADRRFLPIALNTIPTHISFAPLMTISICVQWGQYSPDALGSDYREAVHAVMYNVER